MSLYVKKTIAITAPALRVWQVLTLPENTAKWAGAFSQSAYIALESDWQLGSPVYWKSPDGIAKVDGKVMAVEPGRSMTYTVHDMSGDYDDVQSDDDGIFYQLEQTDGGTLLHIKHGDFAKIPGKGEEFQRLTAESWERALVVIKDLAERH